MRRKPGRPAEDQGRENGPAPTAVLRLSPRLAWCWIVGISLLIVQRPISAPDLWWHLARGRAVAEGVVAPARHLLTLDAAGEADWLGGAPFYAIWRAGGVHALAGLPLLSALAFCMVLARRADGHRSGWPILILPPALAVMRGNLEPIPELFDLCGMIAIWHVLQNSRSVRRRTFAVMAVLAVWSNLGPRPVWGLLLLLLFSPPGVLDGKLLTAALLGGSLNPRGVFAWRDAIILFAPAAWTDLSEHADPAWHPLTSPIPWDNSLAAFSLLWPLCVGRSLSRKPGAVQFARWSAPLLGTIACPANLPASALWLVLDSLAPPGIRGDMGAVSGGLRSGAPCDPAQQTRPRRFPAVNRGLDLAAAGLVLALAFLDAAGVGAAQQPRLGWGVVHAIDPRLMDVEALESSAAPRIGWSPDGRSTGVAVWTGAARMCDHPRRALLGGRWGKHADLINDFLADRRARYRREDGSWGGRLQQLSDWEVQVLFVPMEDHRMHRALIHTSWQAADLDSPTVPRVSAGDLSHAQVVADVLRQQALVEAGPWQPTIEIYDRAGWHWDVPERLGLGPPPCPAIRQSQFFRGLGIPMASLRALLPIRRRGGERRLLSEWGACQSALAWQERETFGDASRFRILVLQRSSPPEGLPEWASEARTEDWPEVAEWKTAVDEYIAGRVREALEELPQSDAQSVYAAAMLHLELGETKQARALLERIRRLEPDAAASIAAEYWISRMGALDASESAPLSNAGEPS